MTTDPKTLADQLEQAVGILSPAQFRQLIVHDLPLILAALRAPSSAEAMREANDEEVRKIADAIRADIVTIRFEQADNLDGLIGPYWIDVLSERAARAALAAARQEGERDDD